MIADVFLTTSASAEETLAPESKAAISKADSADLW
jgi:hypothetical protein